MEQSKGLKIVFLMCLGIFLCMIDTTIMNIALPAIQSSVNTSLEKMSWVLNVYTMTIAVLAIPLGRIADIFGKAKMYILGLVIFGGGSVLCAFANTGDFLIFSRFIQSVGAAILFPTSMVIGVSAMPLAKRHVALVYFRSNTRVVSCTWSGNRRNYYAKFRMEMGVLRQCSDLYSWNHFMLYYVTSKK